MHWATESEKYIILTLFYDQNYVNLSNLKFHPLCHTKSWFFWKSPKGVIRSRKGVIRSRKGVIRSHKGVIRSRKWVIRSRKGVIFKKMKTFHFQRIIWILNDMKKGKYLKTSTMVTVIFMQSVMEIALPIKKLSSKNWSNLSGVWRFSVTNFKLP